MRCSLFFHICAHVSAENQKDGEEFFVKDDLAIASRCELFCIFGNLAITCALYKAKVIK